MICIEGLCKSLKCKNSMEPRKFAEKQRYQRLLSVSAWSVRWVLWYGGQLKLKRGMVQIEHFTLQKRRSDTGKTFVLYRSQMLRLVSFPKPVFDQLAIELPCLMGFRASEVATWKAEYIDFQQMNTQVYDAKKKQFFTMPLNVYVAEHAEIVLNGRAEGNVLRSRSDRNRGEQLTPTSIWYIWDKWTKKAKLPNANDISPNTGRQFFAAEWYYEQGLSLVTLQMILRHAHFETTMRYVRSLVFYENMKRDYDKFQFKLMEALQKEKLLEAKQ